MGDLWKQCAGIHNFSNSSVGLLEIVSPKSTAIDPLKRSVEKRSISTFFGDLVIKMTISPHYNSKMMWLAVSAFVATATFLFHVGQHGGDETVVYKISCAVGHVALCGLPQTL